MVEGLRLLPPRPQRELAEPAFHEWSFPDGAPWARFHRAGAGYVVRFPALADFTISAGAQVDCHPEASVSAETCRHLYLNQVLPLVLSRSGKLVFHASAVEVRGHALAFVGESGRGKSTLAASFAVAGYRFLTDDGLVVERDGAGYRALPSHPSIRLWEDSEAAIVGGAARAAPPVQYTAKGRFLADAAMPFCDEPRPLAAAFFLGPGGATGVEIEPLGGAQALVEWVKSSFLLEPGPGPALGEHFRRLADLANGLPCYRLDYPRTFDALARVREALEGSWS